MAGSAQCPPQRGERRARLDLFDDRAVRAGPLRGFCQGDSNVAPAGARQYADSAASSRGSARACARGTSASASRAAFRCRRGSTVSPRPAVILVETLKR
jgi:hypothetical protein